MATENPVTDWSAALPGLTAFNMSSQAGTRFRPTVTGSVIALRARLSSTGTGIVRLWAMDQTLLVSQSFTITAAGVWQQLTLASPVPVLANSEYIVSIRSSASEYYHSAPGFPKLQGSINLLDSRTIGSDGFPTSVDASFLYPCSDIVFEAGIAAPSLQESWGLVV